MKEDKENKKSNKHIKTTVADTNADTQWFEQFVDIPNIYDMYSKNELNMMKAKMLNDFKKKINRID